MDGLHCLGADVVGFDYMSLAKGAAGLLQGAGGMLADKGGSAAQTAQQQAALQKAQDEKAKAEASAKKLKIGLAVGGGVAALGTVVALLVRRK